MRCLLTAHDTQESGPVPPQGPSLRQKSRSPQLFCKRLTNDKDQRLTDARSSKSASAVSRLALWYRAQATMTTSAAGTVTPRARARLARSYASCQTPSSIGSSGSVFAKSRSTFRSCCPRAPFHSSSCTKGHQQACPLMRAACTRFRTTGSPLGRSICIQDDVSTRIKRSASATRSLKLFRRDQVVARASVPGQFRHAHSAIEVRDGANHGFTLGLCVREPDGILKLTIGNIDCSFHAARLAVPEGHFNV